MNFDSVCTSIDENQHHDNAQMNVSERMNTDKQSTSESIFSSLAQGMSMPDAAAKLGGIS